jgi:hypothetical protein
MHYVIIKMETVAAIRNQIQETKERIQESKLALKELQVQARRAHQRVVDVNWKNNKYHTDPDFREKVKARCLAIYHRKRAEAAAANAAEL